ncbi:MAG TPA: GMC family oxidoreductase [Vicinamibacterales bacterium]|nr:GMC family oxidoreductase [Vicinamibacterales bacterium]
MDSVDQPRAVDGRAPDVFRRDGWLPMRCYADTDEVDFAIVGTGAGGGTLTCKLASAGFRVVAFEAGPFWRPLEDFASDEKAQRQLYWYDERISSGADPIQLGSNNSGRGVGGSTVHFTMLTPRYRPEWFKSRSLLGYAVDWPFGWDDIEPYYDEVEQMLQVAGPLSYPWGRRRSRYPRRAHELNASAIVLARGCEGMGIQWSPAPIATLSSPRGPAPPCTYRGFCVAGCSTNAKQSVLVTWIPRAVESGAEIRDRAMVGRIEIDGNRATGVHYYRQGQWRFQAARQVVVAGYCIETPRLLLNSACPECPEGVANRNGLVGKYLMVHANDGVYGEVDDEVRWYKAPPSLALTEHWNYTDSGKHFYGGYLVANQGPLVRDWSIKLALSTGLWGTALRQEMTRYNHMAGVKMVGEIEPSARNSVEVTTETDQLGLPIPKVTFSYSANDRELIAHARGFMRQMLEAVGARNIWMEADTAHLLGGCRMGTNREDSVTDGYGRTWDIPNLWICDGSLFPTSGGANPSLTIMAVACRIGDHMADLARHGQLH